MAARRSPRALRRRGRGGTGSRCAGIERREYRPAAIAAAKIKIEARAAERFAREQADHEAKLAARAAEAAATGRRPGGKPPKAPTPGPRPDDQSNLTDEESHIMPVAGGGFEQCYNARAVLDTETMLVLATQVTQVTKVTQAAYDKQQLVPMLERLAALPEEINQTEQLLADAGYFSEANVTACDSAGIEPAIAIKRDEHRPPLVGALHEPRSPACRGDSGGAHGPPAEDP